MKKQIIIAFDIGGTNFRYAVFDKHDLKIIEVHRCLAPNFLNYRKLNISELQKLLIDKVCDICRNICNNYQIEKIDIGISFPGPITKNGFVRQACTIWGNKGLNYPIKLELSKRLPKAIISIVNDITAAAERYASIPKYANLDYIGVITVSSGIGSKIYDIQNRKIILDSLGIGGEIGHLKFDFSSNAPACDCGGIGHIGAISSGRAIQRQTIFFAEKNKKDFARSILSKMVNTTKDITNINIVKAIHSSDKFIIKILDKSTYPIAISIAYMSASIGVGKVIIIGGFALACGPKYLESLRKNLLKLDFYGRNKDEVLNMVDLGINDDNDSLIGIAMLAKRKSYAN